MNYLKSTDSLRTMSSREIADATGKHHHHVVRDIRDMIEALGDEPNLSHLHEEKDERGYTACFHLDQDLTLTLVSGYSAKLRYAVVKRWRELESATQAPALDTTPRHSVLAMWQPLNGGKGKLPKKVVQDLEVMRRGYPTAIERDKAHDDYLVATFLAVGLVEQLSQHREDKLGRLKDGLETPDEVWQSFVSARDQLRAEYRHADGVAGLLH